MEDPVSGRICCKEGAKIKTHCVTVISGSRDKQYECEQTEYFKQRIKGRYKIEAKNAELKQSHGLGRCKYAGLFGMKIQIYFTAFVANVKRIVKLEEAIAVWLGTVFLFYRQKS